MIQRTKDTSSNLKDAHFSLRWRTQMLLWRSASFSFTSPPPSSGLCARIPPTTPSNRQLQFRRRSWSDDGQFIGKNQNVPSRWLRLCSLYCFCTNGKAGEGWFIVWDKKMISVTVVIDSGGKVLWTSLWRWSPWIVFVPPELPAYLFQLAVEHMLLWVNQRPQRHDNENSPTHCHNEWIERQILPPCQVCCVLIVPSEPCSERHRTEMRYKLDSLHR